VVGIVSEPAGDSTSDVYIPLARAQALGTSPGGGTLKNDVNLIYVAAASASDISSVQKAISHALPGATVTTSASLASQVTGSLSNADSLAERRWSPSSRPS
jgi:putative ABC transport system permease protein